VRIFGYLPRPRDGWRKRDEARVFSAFPRPAASPNIAGLHGSPASNGPELFVSDLTLLNLPSTNSAQTDLPACLGPRTTARDRHRPACTLSGMFDPAQASFSRTRAASSKWSRCRVPGSKAAKRIPGALHE
jgi:hypothetical protein